MASFGESGALVGGAIFLSILGFSSAGQAAEWDLTPSIGLIGGYSDNVSLAPEGAETASAYAQINPAIRLHGRGRQGELDLSYRMQNIYYDEAEDRDRTYHQAAALLSSELLRESLFLDINGRLTQSVIDPLGRVPVDNVSITDNRTDTATLRVNPYFIQRFGRSASARLDYTYGQVEYSNVDNNEQSHTGLLRFQSGPRFDDVTWALNGRYAEIKQEASEERIAFDQAWATLRFRVLPRTALIAEGGYENNTYPVIEGQPTPEGTYWAGGFAWNPTRRTDLEFTWGERFFGRTAFLNFNHRSARLRWGATYSDQLTTSSQNLLGSETSPDAPELAPPGITRDVYLLRRGTLTVTYDRRVRSATLGVYAENRDYQTTVREEDVLGGNLAWQSHVGRSTSWGLTGDWSRRDFKTQDRIDDLFTGAFRFERLPRPDITVALIARHTQRESTDPGLDYRENRVELSADFRF